MQGADDPAALAAHDRAAGFVAHRQLLARFAERKRALRAWRRDEAAHQHVPPYVIFHDAVLRAMASERPATRSALGAIPGVGAKKLEAWGDAFLSVIRQF